LSLLFENVLVTTDDGLEQTATHVPSRNGAAVLLCPSAGARKRRPCSSNASCTFVDALPPNNKSRERNWK
jgi:hypothetical protein